MVTWARTVPSIPSCIAFLGINGGAWVGQTTPMSCLPDNVLGAGGAGGGGGGAMTADSFGGADTAAVVGACVGGDTSGGGTKGGGGA